MSVVLITGSCGLVGSESVKFFIKKGFEVESFGKAKKAIHRLKLELTIPYQNF